MSPLVSVVIPCFDTAPYIAEAIASALGQSHDRVEVIVIDDGSTDGSSDVIATFGGRIISERVTNGGAPRARNRGLALARGEAVVFLDADDLLAPDTIAASLVTLEAAHRRSVVAAPWSYLVRDGAGWRAQPHDVKPAPNGDPLAGWLVRRYQATASLLWPSALVRDLGGWDETLTKNQDGDLAMRAFVAGAGLAFSRARGSALYRHYGAGSHSLASRVRAIDVESCIRVIDKVAAGLRTMGRFEPYRVWVARGYHELAHLYFASQPELARVAAARAEELAGARAIWGSWSHRVATTILGLEGKERLAAKLARLGFGDQLRRLNARGTEQSTGPGYSRRSR